MEINIGKRDNSAKMFVFDYIISPPAHEIEKTEEVCVL